MNHVNEFSNKPTVFPTEVTKENTVHQWEDHNILLDPNTDTIELELTDNHIHCETTGRLLGYWDTIKNYAPVWDKSMSNELVRLSQGWKEHAGIDTMEFILHQEMPKYRNST